MITRPERRQRPSQKPIELHRRDIRRSLEVLKQDIPEVRDGQAANPHIREVIVDVFLETHDWVKIALCIRMDCLGLVIEVRLRCLCGECGQAGDTADHVVHGPVREHERDEFGHGHAGAVVEDEDECFEEADDVGSFRGLDGFNSLHDWGVGVGFEVDHGAVAFARI